MRLRRIAKQRWDVLAYCDARGKCQVMEFLAELNPPQLAQAMLRVLDRYVPEHGPMSQNPELSKSLERGIYEFRKRPHRGKVLRVLYFFDARRVVVCTRALTKDAKLPPGVVDKAVEIKERYGRSKTDGTLEITD